VKYVKKVEKIGDEIKKIWTFIYDKSKRTDERMGKVEKQLPSTDFGLAMANDKITEIVNDKNSLKMN